MWRVGKRSWILILVISGLVLAGCVPPEEVVTVTPRAVVTGTLLATWTAVETPMPMKTASATVTVRAKASEEVSLDNSDSLSTDTPIQHEPIITRPANLPTVPFQADIPYGLTQPPFAALLETMRRGAEFEDIFLSEYGGRSPYWSITKMIEMDMNSFYVDPFPDTVMLLNDGSLRSIYFAWYEPPEVLLALLKNGIHQYLNQRKEQLVNGTAIEEEGFKLTPFSIELDNDLMPEWLIQFESLIFQARIFLLFDQNESTRYELIPSSLPTFWGRSYSDGWSELIIDKDFTGDGINEIVIDSVTVYSGFSGRILEVFTWADGLIMLEQIVDISHAVFEVADLDGDGLIDIRVSTQYFDRFGCEWVAVDLYRWPGQVGQHTLSNHERPETAVCNLARATTPFSALWNPTKDGQSHFLEQAVNLLRTDPDVNEDFLVYALSQLAMAYVEQGLDDQARRAINDIYEIPGESKYQQSIRDYDQSDAVIDLCRNLVANAERILETDIGSYLTEAGFLMSRGIIGDGPYKPAICDLKYIGLTRVQNAVLPAATPPGETLAGLNVQYAFAQTVNLDDDPELEWIGILEPEAPWLVVFDTEGDWWVPHFVYEIYAAPVLGLNFEHQRIASNDKVNNLVLIVAESPDDLLYTTEYTILLIDKVDHEYSIIARKYLYDEQPDLRNLLQDFLNLDQPAVVPSEWEQLDGFLEKPVSISTYIQYLTDSILTQTDPTIPTQITDLLDYLPTDDGEARPYREHLTYLLGYHYELSGDADTAVATYLSLIQQTPDSPWAWLAWARLEPVE